MATTVDALLVTLGLDATNFKKGSKEAELYLKAVRDDASRTGKQLESDGARAAAFFSQIKTEALSLIGILLGGKGLESFMRDTTRSLADLGRQARNIGEAAPGVEAFAMAIERMGGSAENARGFLQTFAQQREEFIRTGKGNFGVEMGLIGGNLDTKPLDALRLFMAYVEKHKGEPQGIQDIQLWGKQLFGADEATLNSLIQIGTVANLNKEIARSFELGVPTQEQIDRATRLQTAMIGLEQASSAAGRALLNDLSPGLTTVADGMSHLISANPKGAESIIAMATALGLLGAIRLSASAMGITVISSALDGLFLLASRLGLITAAGVTGYEALHVSGAGTGEDAEINREREAHGEGPRPTSSATPTRDPFASFMRAKIALMSEGPFKRYLKSKFGSEEIADTSMTPEQQAFLQTLSDPESGGAYDVKNGGSTFTDFSKFPEGIGPGGTSSAAGRYQFTSDTWKEAAAALGLTDFSPASQDKAAWWLAQREYRQKTDRDLQTDIAVGGHEADVSAALSGRWPSLPGGSQSSQSLNDFSGRLARHYAEAPRGGGGPSNITIGTIVVNTQATDAKGIARDISGALVNQANRGPQ